MKTEWSPWPWRAVVRANQHGPQMVAVDMPPRGGAWRPTRKDLTPVDVANARLIAAAPELYEALWHLVSEFEPFVEEEEPQESHLAAYNRAEAALRKAREGA